MHRYKTEELGFGGLWLSPGPEVPVSSQALKLLYKKDELKFGGAEVRGHVRLLCVHQNNAQPQLQK